MSTTITTTNPVRSDVTTGASSEPTRPHSRAWALAGLGAAVASIAGTVGAGLVHGVYGHWIGTVPGCTMLLGLGGLGVFAASRRGGVPRWLGVAGLVLGGLTVLLGISPLQYMAGMTSALWLIVTALGFTFGDRAHRRA